MSAARVLVADPPWKFRDRLPGAGRGAGRHYPLLTVEELERFPLPELADDCYLFLWKVAALPEEALRVCKAWEFVPKTEIIWEKVTKNGKPFFGMGHHLRAAHETAILAVRGKPKPKVRNVRSRFSAPVGRHSEKPQEFFEIVERFADGPFVEMFSRRQRDGWTCLGNEVAQ